MASFRFVFFAALLGSCVGAPVDRVQMALGDPLELIDDVEGPLRLLVLPARDFSCDPATGLVSPDVPDVAIGELMDATVDVEIDVGAGMAMGEVDVPGGSYVVLVRGRGTDPVSGRRDVIIASGCSDANVAGGQTASVSITLREVVLEGVCGDSVVSGNEQCDDGNTTSGDGCDARCSTEPIFVNNDRPQVQDNPTIGGSPGQRMATLFDSNRSEIRIRLLDGDGGGIDEPALLANESSASAALGLPSGIFLIASTAVHSSGRIAVAVTDFRDSASPAVRVGFLSQLLTSSGDAEPLGVNQQNPAVAYATDGTLLVAYEEEASATGIDGRVFRPGTTVPTAADVSIGRAGATDVGVAGASDGFWVVYTADDDVWVERVDRDGARLGGEPQRAGSADGSGVQDQPDVASLADGRALVTWRESGADSDGDGTAVRGQIFQANGVAGAPFVVNTTAAGDQGAPTVAAGEVRFAVVFESGDTLRARLFDATGSPQLSREPSPSTNDFLVVDDGVDPEATAAGTSELPGWAVIWTDRADISARFYPF